MVRNTRLIRRTKTVIACTFATMVIFSGCTASNPPAAVANTPPPASDCPYPDAPDQSAPRWICHENIDSYPVSGLGFYKHEVGGPSVSKDIAEVQARNELARSLRVFVQNMIKNFTRATGRGEDGTYDFLYENVSKHLIEETIFGSRIVRSRTSPKGTVYVLVGLDTAKVTENAKLALEKTKTSMNNSAASYQKEEAQKALLEMERQLDKYVKEAAPVATGN